MRYTQEHLDDGEGNLLNIVGVALIWPLGY